jgi:hypothetical protein
MQMEDVISANPSRAGGLPSALVEPDGLLPFDTSSAVCNAQHIAPSGIRPSLRSRPLTLRPGLTTS